MQNQMRSYLSKSSLISLTISLFIFLHSTNGVAEVPWQKNALKQIPPGFDVPEISLLSDNFHVGQYFSSSRGDDADYLVWIPQSYSEVKSYNLVIFLGGGMGSMYNMAAELDQQLTLLQDSELENFIFLAPDLNCFSLWANVSAVDGPTIVSEMKEEIALHVKLSGRTFLIGHSNGGAGAIHLALTQPQSFLSVAAINPTLLMWSPFAITDQQLEDYQKNYAPDISLSDLKLLLSSIRTEFETDEAWQAFDPYNLIKNISIQIPISIYSGKKDPLGFWYLSQEFVKEAAKNNITISLYEDLDQGHEIGQSFKEIFKQFKNTYIEQNKVQLLNN